MLFNVNSYVFFRHWCPTHWADRQRRRKIDVVAIQLISPSFHINAIFDQESITESILKSCFLVWLWFKEAVIPKKLITNDLFSVATSPKSPGVTIKCEHHNEVTTSTFGLSRHHATSFVNNCVTRGQLSCFNHLYDQSTFIQSVGTLNFKMITNNLKADKN